MKLKYFIFILIIVLFSFTNFEKLSTPYYGYETIEALRNAYEQESTNWPKPELSEGVDFKELGVLLPNPTVDKKLAKLGKILFFDPRLSSSNKLSCASCHDPSNNWADKEVLAIGHEGLVGNRNTPSIENVWIQKELFWDGRASSLQQQQKMSIENPVEMFQDSKDLPKKLSAIQGYKTLFKTTFGKTTVSTSDLMDAITAFQQTIVSNPTDLDFFIKGNYKSLTDQQVWGLHLFRTKGRCINCHNGSYLTDSKYHNQGFTFYKRKREDLGRYNVTKKPQDVGKFKTPSLRNTMKTGPWFHNGIFPNIQSIISMYNGGMNRPYRRLEYENDSLFPVTSNLIHKLNLSKEEQNALIAFLESLNSDTSVIAKPTLP